MIDARVVDLVENPVAQREPDTAVAADGCAEAAFRARRPAGRNTRPARSKGVRIFSHAPCLQSHRYDQLLQPAGTGVLEVRDKCRTASSQLRLAPCANVQAVRGTPQKPLPDEREEEDTTGIRVQSPEPSRLYFREIQSRHLAVFAFDSSDERRQAAPQLSVNQVFGCQCRHNLVSRQTAVHCAALGIRGFRAASRMKAADGRFNLKRCRSL